MKLTNPVVFILLAIFTIVNIIDAMTGLFILPAEANPIYLLFNSFIPVILGKTIICLVAWWIYKVNTYTSKTVYYSFLLTILLGTLLFSIGIASNTIGMLNPDLVQESSQLNTVQKIQGYSIFVGLLGILPWMISLLTFYLYQKSKKHVKLMR